MANVDRLVVKSANPLKSQILFEESEPTEVAKVVQSIEFARFGPNARCACYGDVVLEFQRGQELVLTFSFHHRQNLRWWEGWPSDIPLTRASAAFLVKWISDNTPDKDLLQGIGYTDLDK